MNVTILGLGLLGGSLGLALRRLDPPEHVTGWARRAETRDLARELGAVDATAATVAEAVREADLVVLGVPVLAMRDLLAACAPHLRDGAIVTDVGSTKAAVVAWAAELLPPSVTFIGGHPMAGREQSGLEAATPDLFRDCTWALAPPDPPNPAAMGTLLHLIQRLGATALMLGAADHDRRVAAISHVPFLVETALVLATAGAPDWPRNAPLAATGYRDASRLAAGDPIMYRDICLTNGPAILPALDAFSAQLTALRQAIEAGDADIEARFRQARALRQEWWDEASRRLR